MNTLEKELAETFRINRIFGIQGTASMDSTAVGAARVTWSSLRHEVMLILKRNDPNFNSYEFIRHTESDQAPPDYVDSFELELYRKIYQEKEYGKIPAIKEYRARRDCSLREAKDAIEDMAVKYNWGEAGCLYKEKPW